MSKHPFVPLRRRPVRILWSAAVLSDVGTWVQLVVVGSLIASHTHSALRTGLVALATFMPQGFAAPIGGLLADRYDRRRVFATALLVQAAMTSLLAVALGAGVRSPGPLTLLIMGASAAGSFGAPSYSAMQPDLVPDDELVAMVSLGVYSWNGGRILGPIIGTVLSAAVGPAWTIAFNAVTFVVMSFAVLSVRQRFQPSGIGGTMARRMIDGWTALRSTPGCWHSAAFLVWFNVTIVPFIGLIPIYAIDELGGGTGLVGALSSAQGIGAIIGGIVVGGLATTFGRSQTIRLLVPFVGVSLAAYAVAPGPRAAMILVAMLGAGGAASFITGTAVIQRDAPPDRRGRVMSLNQALLGTTYGIGLLIFGFLGD
ncbi:MAG: MFS transporter [Ilumatobacteraceae bacterium]